MYCKWQLQLVVSYKNFNKGFATKKGISNQARSTNTNDAYTERTLDKNVKSFRLFDYFN